MKKKYSNLYLVLFLLLSLSLFGISDSQAAEFLCSPSNTTGYISLQYGPSGSSVPFTPPTTSHFAIGGGLAKNGPCYKDGKFRVFVLPGTKVLNIDGNNSMQNTRLYFISRFNKFPGKKIADPFSDANILKLPYGGTKLKTLKDGDYHSTNANGIFSIITDGYSYPIAPNEAGWVYVDADFGSGASISYANATGDIDLDAFNDWYKHSGSNSDGSINWEKDVESMTTYAPINNHRTDCNKETCVGNSCWDGAKFVVGTKTTGCATGTATADPNPGKIGARISSVITWKSENASVTTYAIGEFENRMSPARGSTLSGNSGSFNYTERRNTDYRVFTFFPRNSSNDMPGTPYFVKVDFKKTGGSPNCAADTCVGNNCYDGSKDIPGTKTQGCATGTVSFAPTAVTPISENPPKELTYLTWSSINTSKLEVACTGPTTIARAEIQKSSTEWMTDAAKSGLYTKPAGAPDGYPGWFHVGTSGTFACTFYPTNQADGKPGTPFKASVEVKKPGGSDFSCTGTVPTNATKCTDDDTELTATLPWQSVGTSASACTATRKCEYYGASSHSGDICIPDDPDCANHTCKDVSCNNGCNMLEGVKDCIGRR
ncbi:MAG: hypothetical protein WC848_06325 [Parcubacteria group bacterium]|jgi:hypothetical protein